MLDGKWPNVKPSRASDSSSVTPMAPGPTARRGPASSFRAATMRLVSTTTVRVSQAIPPQTPLPAPKGTSGKPSRRASVTSAATSSVVRGAHDRGRKPTGIDGGSVLERDEVSLPEILRARDAFRNVEAHVTRKALGEQARDIGRFRHAKLVLRIQLAECLERDACASWSGPRGCTANAAACLVGRSKPRLAAVAEAECERGVTTARAAERSERSPATMNLDATSRLRTGAVWPPPGEGWTPPPCQLEASTVVRRRASVFEVTARLKNVTSELIVVEMPDRCPQGPAVFSGLPEGYDYYHSCTKGACGGRRHAHPSLDRRRAIDRDRGDRNRSGGSRLQSSARAERLFPRVFVSNPT